MTAQRCKTGLLIYPRVSGDSELKDGQLRLWSVHSFGSVLTVGAIGIDLMELGAKEGVKVIDQTIADQIRFLAAQGAAT